MNTVTSIDLPSAAKPVRRHLAHGNASIVDRRAEAHRAETCCPEHEPPAGLIRDQGRHVERSEVPLLLGRRSCLEADILPRQQRIEPGDAAQRDRRLNDPELRILHHQRRGVLGDLRGHLHFGVVFGELDRRHLADGHVLVLDERLAGLDARSGLEDDGDRRAFLADPLDRYTDGDYRGEDRNDPDDGDAQPFLTHRAGLRQIVEIAIVSHARARGDRHHPRSGADRTTRPQAW